MEATSPSVTPFDSHAYQDVPWYLPPYDTIFPMTPMTSPFCFTMYSFLLPHAQFAYLRETVITLISLLLRLRQFVNFLSVPKGWGKNCMLIFNSPHKHPREYFLNISGTVLWSNEITLNYSLDGEYFTQSRLKFIYFPCKILRELCTEKEVIQTLLCILSL
jgi:hypothetical protein